MGRRSGAGGLGVEGTRRAPPCSRTVEGAFDRSDNVGDREELEGSSCVK
jgi:hypothetical protein